MNILVIGGMHGNEPLGPAVVKLFQTAPIPNVDVVLANKEALRANTRFVEQDLNRSFPGEARSVLYESRRAAQLLRLTKQYDVVLDFHNTHCSDNDCGFVGDDASKELYDVSWLLGLDRVIVADYECVNKYATNCLSIEVSLDSQLNRPEIWYERIALLSRLDKIAVTSKVKAYRFVYRMTLEDKERLDLAKQNLRAFQPMDEVLAGRMGVASPAFPIFIGDAYTPYNYGGVLNELRQRHPTD